jgi:sugar lactone lactonase YvrE
MRTNNIDVMHRTGSLLTSFTLTLTGLLALTALGGTSVARADTVTPFPKLANFHQMVLDSAHGFIFISEGESSNSTLQGYPSTSGLIVTDLSGKFVTTLDPGDGVDGLALSSDGGTLYAALAGDSAVAAIQVSSIKASNNTASQVLYPLPTGDVPYSVALQSGKVWVSYQPANDTFAGVALIGDIDLSAATPATAFEPADASVTGATGWYSPPDLAADPSDSGLLVAAAPGSSLSSAATFNTTTSPETSLASGNLGGTYTAATCGFESQIAVIPGGADFVAACGSPKGPEIFSPSNLATAVATYADDKTGPVAVAVSPSGLIATGDASTDNVTTNTTIPANVYVYSPAGIWDNTIPVATSGYAQFGKVAGWGALAWSPDGSTLYALTSTQVLDGITNPVTYALDVITAPTLTRATVTLNGPASVGVTKSIALTGKVALSNGTLPPAGTPVTITRALGAATAHFTVDTKANGTFALTDTTAGNIGGAYKYTARYAGSTTTASASTTRTVQVVKLASGLSISLGPTTINYGTTTVVTAHLAKTYTNRTVWVYAQLAEHGKQLIGRGNVNSKGNFTVHYKAPYNATFSATFSGDNRVAAGSVSHSIRVRAGVSESLSGYYGTSGSYRLYTGSETLTAHVTVTPNKKTQCSEIEIDQYFEGAWTQIGVSPCFKLGTASKLDVLVNLSGLADSSGPRYRIRADYTASSTEKLNLGNDSGWQYFIVY